MKKKCNLQKIIAIFVIEMYFLTTARMQLALHHPEDGFYRGTRFDRSGVFDGLLVDGLQLCDRWYPRYDPYLHDTVCGPAEEFTLCGAVKVGVGLLLLDAQPYDRFRLYPVADSGVWTAEEGDGRVVFRHRLEGYYTYEKEIALTGEASFAIRHAFTPALAWTGEVYNHNFFTMGRLETGPSREVDFPFRPEGDWRAVYDSVGFTESGIRFSRRLQEGESVYTGNIHAAGQTGMPYEMTLREGRMAVHIRGSVPVTRTVLWANHRIACLEPYNALDVGPGVTFRWNVEYAVEKK